MIRAIAGLWLLLGTTSLFADIIFIDYNNSPCERDAALAAGKIRYEAVHFFPDPKSLSPKNLARINEITKTMKNLEVRIRAGDSSLYGEYTTLAAERGKIAPTVDKSSINEWLKGLSDKNTQITSFVLSAHDGGGHFGGSNSGEGDGINGAELKEIFESKPELAKNIRSVALLGCYTGTVGQDETNWKQIFPGNTVVGGFEGLAPLANVESSCRLLTDFLVKDKEFQKANSLKELERTFNSLKLINNFNFSVCFKDFYVTKEKASTFTDLDKACEQFTAENELSKTYECYRQALPGCENLPENTASGPLRDYYTLLRKNAHCAEKAKIRGEYFPNDDDVMRLLFFNNVKENFSRIYHEDLAALKQAGTERGVEGCDFTSMSGLTRAAIIKNYSTCTNGLSAHDENALKPFNPALMNRMKAQDALETIFYMMSAKQCVPFGWIEPNATDPSPCKTTTPEKMQKSKLAYYYFQKTMQDIQGQAKNGMLQPYEITNWIKSQMQQRVEHDIANAKSQRPQDIDPYMNQCYEKMLAYYSKTKELHFYGGDDPCGDMGR